MNSFRSLKSLCIILDDVWSSQLSLTSFNFLFSSNILLPISGGVVGTFGWLGGSPDPADISSDYCMMLKQNSTGSIGWATSDCNLLDVKGVICERTTS